jgi:hypothetical protein
MGLSPMTIRHWLIAVAVIAALLWVAKLCERRRELLERAEECSDLRLIDTFETFEPMNEQHFHFHRWNAWRDAVEKKYRFAANHPWLPVEPNPPDAEWTFSDEP